MTPLIGISGSVSLNSPRNIFTTGGGCTSQNIPLETNDSFPNYGRNFHKGKVEIGIDAKTELSNTTRPPRKKPILNSLQHRHHSICTPWISIHQ
jgi:hypothetical protein